MAKAAKKSEVKTQLLTETVQILRIEKATATFYVLGTTPLVMNRMPKKAREHLLLPPRQRNKAELQATLKHNPPAEFNDAIYRCRESTAPTLIHLPNGCFKKAIAQAAIDIPGATKAQIGRLVSVQDVTVHLYGKPWLYMDVVRLAGPSHAPDIRTRAMFPEWACKVTLGFIKRLIIERDLMNLFAAAGLITGIGDGRTEKGSRDNGQWELVSATNPAWNRIVREQGRKVQEEAMRAAEAVDADSEELLAWYGQEIVRREQEPEMQEEEEEVEITASGKEAIAMLQAEQDTKRNGRRRRGDSKPIEERPE